MTAALLGLVPRIVTPRDGWTLIGTTGWRLHGARCEGRDSVIALFDPLGRLLASLANLPGQPSVHDVLDAMRAHCGVMYGMRAGKLWIDVPRAS